MIAGMACVVHKRRQRTAKSGGNDKQAPPEGQYWAQSLPAGSRRHVCQLVFMHLHEQQRTLLSAVEICDSWADSQLRPWPPPGSDWGIKPEDIHIICRPDGTEWLLGQSPHWKVYKGLKGGVQVGPTMCPTVCPIQRPCSLSIRSSGSAEFATTGPT